MPTSLPEHCTQILCKNQTISRYLTTRELQEIIWYYMRIQLQGESPRAWLLFDYDNQKPKVKFHLAPCWTLFCKTYSLKGLFFWCFVLGFFVWLLFVFVCFGGVFWFLPNVKTARIVSFQSKKKIYSILVGVWGRDRQLLLLILFFNHGCVHERRCSS